MNKNFIRNILWFFIGILAIVAVWGQKADIIDCTNEEMVTSVFNEPIDLNLRGVIKIYENVTINEILSTTNNEFEINYIDARLEPSALGNDTKNLVLFTTQQFENYAREQTAARISLKLNLGCGMGKERVVIFFQPLKEGNYFSPIFSKSLYEIFIPTPIFAGFDLTAFHEITATDDDLTHNQIDFTSSDSSLYHLSVGTKNTTTIDKKTYFAKIILKKILLELPQPITIQIKATDNGIPPKSSMASVIIRADPENQLPIQPRFKQALYKSIIEFDLSMPAIQIEMVNGTYSPELIFSLRGLSIKGFHLEDHKNGSIEVKWSPANLNRSEIIKHPKWELELRAEHINLMEFGRATVIVELADFQNYFCFMSLYQEGYIDEIGELHIEPIIFNPAIYQSDMRFELLTSHDIFRLINKTYTIQLQLNQNFTWQLLDDEEFLKLTLKASWESLSSVMHIIIKLPQVKDIMEPQLFQFEKPLYVGHLNATDDLELETILLRTDVDYDVQHDVELSLSGIGSTEFSILYNGSAIEMKTNFSSKPILNEYFLVLEAKAKNDRKTFSTLIIKKHPVHVAESTFKKCFLNPMIVGQVVYDNVTMLQSYKGESIYIFNDIKENLRNLKINLSGDYALNFDAKINFSTFIVDLELITPLPDQVLKTKQFLNLTLQALLQEPEQLNDTVRIIIALPIKECSQVEHMQSEALQFSSSSYVFTTFTNQTGLLGVVNAFSGYKNASIHYILEVESDILAQRLSIGPFTGELFLYGTIDKGDYLFNITAESKETHERASVKAFLKVQQKEECKLYEGPTVEKTLVVRHVEEEKPFYGLMDLKFNENCSFYIEDIRPNDKEYVHVNYIFNMLDVIALDREDPIFENKLEPEVMVKLRLKCDKDPEQNFLDIDIPKPEERTLESIGIWDDVSYNPDVMWLFIKIDDINDNAPQFNYSEGHLYLGYPSKDDSLEIYPEYLFQMQAFDLDVGFNAEIKYSMRENLYFGIEPLTGKIYPKGNFLENQQQVELIIFATDQYGEGLTAVTVVIVKALTPDFYSLITLSANAIKTSQEVEQLLIQETGYDDIKVLKMSYLPLGIQPRSFENQSLSCKAWIYAFQRDQLVPFKEMQEKILVENPYKNILNIQSYQAAGFYAHKDDDNYLGYIIATILLSLISCSSLAFIIWRYCYKSPVSFKSNKQTSTQSGLSNKNGNVKPTMPATCSHDFVKAEDCEECHTIEDSNCVKFSDHVENVFVEEAQTK